MDFFNYSIFGRNDKSPPLTIDFMNAMNLSPYCCAGTADIIDASCVNAFQRCSILLTRL